MSEADALPAAAALRGARDLLRRHVLLSCAIVHPAVPKPQALRWSEYGLHYRAAAPGTAAPRLADVRQGVWGAEAVLGLAAALASALLAFEQAGVVHGALSPHVVRWDARSAYLQIDDLSRGRFAREVPAAVRQRLATGVDDLQAAGRLLLWLATGGEPPWQAAITAQEALSLAGMPALSALDPRVLLQLRRLLQAGTADGYADAAAFVAGLADGAAPPPDAGRHAAVWTLPADRFGRTQELGMLLDAFAAVSPRSSASDTASPPQVRPVFALVEGLSGVGKTSVVQAACRRMAVHGAAVAEGKFDQFGHRQPLAALLAALGQVLAGVLAQPAEARARTAERLRETLGALASVLAAALPALPALIGAGPVAPDLGGEASRARHGVALRRLVAGLASGEQPLVLFIDDLQWADTRSLELLAALLDDPAINHLLLIGAYRSEAVHASHPLRTWIDTLQGDAGQRVRPLQVQSWAQDDIAALLQTAGVHDAAQRGAAAQLLDAHCAGNPFTVLQALRLGADEGAIRPGSGTRGWDIDIAALRALTATGGVQALVRRRIERLPTATRDALFDAAHLGPAWSVELLGAARGCSALQACRDLAPAAAAGLLQLLDEAAAPAQALALKFLHDVVQRAAYDLQPQTVRDDVRLRLGRTLLARADADGQLEPLLYPILQQFNAVAPAAVPAALQLRLLALNEQAARRARAQGASRDCLHHFLRAIACSPAGAPFELLREAIEAAYLAADFAQADALVQDALARAATPLQHGQVSELRVLLLLARNRLGEALALGTVSLDPLGVPLLPPPGPQDWPAVPEAAAAAAPTGPSEVRVDCALRILVALTPCAFITSFEMYARVIRTMVQQAQQWPGSVLTPLSWTNYGLTLCGVGRPVEGFGAGRLALAQSAGNSDPGVRTRVEVLTYGFLQHWQEPAVDSIAPLSAAYERCLVYGEQEYLGYAAFLLCDKTWATQPLQATLVAHRLRTEMVRQCGHDFSWKHCRVWLQGMAALRHAAGAHSALQLDGPDFVEAVETAALESARNGFSLFTTHLLRAALAWHRGDLPAAAEACDQALRYEANGTALLGLADLQVLRALTRPDQPDQAQAARSRLAAFAAAAPANFAHKLDLADACLAAQARDWPAALYLFERARGAARTQGFLRDQAMAEQCCGEALEQAGLRSAARRWLVDAHGSYLRWGATAVAERLLAQHPWIQPETLPMLVQPPSLEQRLRRWLQAFGARRIAVRYLESGETLVAEQLGEHRCRVRTVREADTDLPLWPALLLDAVSRQGTALMVASPALDPAWSGDPYFALQQPALAWACAIGETGALVGQAYVECAGPRLLMTPGALAHASRQIEDIVEAYRHQRAEQGLARSRHTDEPTRLPNRSGFAALLERSLAHARESDAQTAALYLVRPRPGRTQAADADDGWDAAPLHQIVLRLQHRSRHGAVVGRLEHRLLGLAYLTSDPPREVLADARALLDALEAPLADGRRLLFDLAVARAEPRMGADALIARAERLLAQAPSFGPAQVVSTDQPADPAAAAGVDLLADLDWAIQHGGLRLVFEPIVDMADHRLLGGEALLRWTHPAIGPVPPDRFIGAAERFGLIRHLGRWVVGAFVAQLGAWHAEGLLGAARFGFNVSPIELMHPDYAAHLLRALASHGLPADAIALEVTESACLQSDAVTRDNLARLAASGMALCIDDFGVGMSSLGRLHEFPAKRLKIDRSFIEGVQHDPGRRSTVTMIVRLAEALQMDVVAEGVTTPEQVAFLLETGLRSAQGFLYARAMESTAMEQLLRSGMPVRPNALEPGPT